jgi:hypothetical protein
MIHMKKYSKRSIRREYIISSAELKEFLGLEGEICGMNLHTGRSPNDVEKGVSPDKDTWEITTKEGEDKESENNPK